MRDKNDIKIGFIGFGNMAQAIAQGLLKEKSVRADQIFACALNWEKLKGNTEPVGMNPCRDAAETVTCSDIVVIAVKPYLIEEVVGPVKELLKDKIVVSVAAGRPFDWYEDFLIPGTHHISTVPNTPVSVGEGIFICEKKHSLTEEEYALIKEILSPIGLLIPVETGLLDISGTICGCGPAFVSMFMEALGDAAVKHKIPRALAYQMVGQMVAGTGKLMVETGSHPGVMKDAVCSPGGTTIVGVAALERKGFRSAVIDAVDAIEGRTSM